MNFGGLDNMAIISSNRKGIGTVLNPLDMIASMGRTIEANKGLLDTLPASLKKWGEFLEFLTAKTQTIEETILLVKLDTAMIIHLLDPHRLPQNIAEEMMACAAEDPRNGRNPNLDAAERRLLNG